MLLSKSLRGLIDITCICIHRTLAFWKSPRRKLFAVIGTDRKRSIVLDSDDDDFEPTRKRLRTENKLDLVLDSMDSIKETLSDVMSLRTHAFQ